MVISMIINAETSAELYSDYIQSANVLFHFMQKSDYLKEILTKKPCSVCGQDILIYTANLLENAVIKEIIENRETGKTKMLYDEADNNPMFISYTGLQQKKMQNKS